MKTVRHLVVAALLLASVPSFAVMRDTDPRAMALGQAYTALARGPEAVFWNPANLALSDSPSFSWNLAGVGFSLITENNSFSISTYNDNFTESNDSVSPTRGTLYYISDQDKDDILADIPSEGLKMNVEVEPFLALGIPINGGVAFPMPWGVKSAVAIGFSTGFEGEIPKDVFEIFLRGNEFDFAREQANRSPNYDIADWDGSGWVLGSLNIAGAKALMPAQLKPYLSEFTVGATLKFVGGAYGEVVKSGGTGLISRLEGTDVDMFVLTQNGGGGGVGLDFGVAGVSKNRKITGSIGVLNLLDAYSWSTSVRQDSIFVTARDLRVTRFMDPDQQNIEEALDNPKECTGPNDPTGVEYSQDCTGDVVFQDKQGEESFSRSLPAMLRIGGAYRLMPKLTLVGNYDQAFTSGFGITSTPRLSAGAEYRLVQWFSSRAGISLGGRSNGSSIGIAFGPFKVWHTQLELMDLALVTRGGFFPGISKGTAISLQLFRFSLI